MPVDPGDALPVPGFENPAAAAGESAGVVGIARDPDDPANERVLLEAAEAWMTFSARFAMRARWGTAHAALRSRRPDAALRHLRPLHDELEADSRLPLLCRVRRSMRSAGVGISTIDGEAVGPLSGAQATVLDLVARGLGTKMIARRLLVGHETVNAHTKAAMRRLRVPTRVAAALEFARLRGGAPGGLVEQSFMLAVDDPASRSVASGSDAVPGAPWSLVGMRFTIRVADLDDVHRALLVAIRGASLDVVPVPDLATDVRSELVSSLERIAPVAPALPGGSGGEGDPASCADGSPSRATTNSSERADARPALSVRTRW